jgi:hypothetical protein
MTYFFGVYPSDRALGRLFDLARLIAQPDYARKAHITLRGPYSKKPSPRSKWYRFKPSRATLTRPATFFNETQNTVYLGLHFLEIEDISWKRDYKDGIPHMSIYDGSDRVFAWQVFQLLQKFPWKMEVDLTPVQILEKKKEYESSFFLELDDIDIAFGYISEKPLRREYIRTMHSGQRVYFLESIFAKIHDLSSTFPA